MQILPTLDPDIEDKIMLLKVFRHEMPMPTSTAELRKVFERALLAQLPAFLHYLDGWQIPAHLVASRVGIRHYHHPDLVNALRDMSPETQLLRLIDEVLFPAGPKSESWVGLSSGLDRKLKDSGIASVAREAADLLKGNVQCGTYLGRLATQNPKRVIRIAKNGGCQKWLIKPPHRDDDAGDAGFSPTPSQRPNYAVLDQKLANYRAARQQQSEVAGGTLDAETPTLGA